MAVKLHNEIMKISQGKETLARVKASIIHRKKFLNEAIKKYISILQHHLSIQERKLLHSVDEMSSCKVQALIAQEKTLHEFSSRCEELYLLIKTLQKDSDSSVIEERPTIEKLVDGMLSVSRACQVKPQAQNTLILQCCEDAIDMMDKYVGTIEHICADEKDEQQDERTYENNEIFLKNVIQKLEEKVFQRDELEDNEYPQECSEDESEEDDEEEDVEEEEDEDEDNSEEEDVEEEEDEDEDNSEEDDDEEEEETLEEEEENESRAEAEDDEATSEGELIGAVGGNMLPEAQQDERPKYDKEINKKQGLLRELQHEIERLRLLGPRGDIIRVVDDTSSSSDSENETADGSNTRSLQLDLQITVNNDLGGARPRSRATTSSTMGDLVTVANNRLTRDRKTEPSFHKRKQCSVNCQYHLKPTLKCKNCCRVFCKSCASVSLHCNKSEHGHDFVAYRGQDADQPKRQKIRRKVQWECKRCTMVNESHVLVCGACETSKDFDPNQVRNVCPMCTLVNEPGKTNCELCDTDLEECFN